MFEGLPKNHFGLIAADVPWNFKAYAPGGDRAAERHYNTQSLDWIAQLPVVGFAARHCHLMFWVTGPFLAKGAHVRIMRSWGFEPTAIWGVWIKPTKKSWNNGHLMLDDHVWKMGLGHTSRQNAEFVVIGRRGSPKRLSKKVRQLIVEPLREHSRKPEAFYRNAEAYGAGPRLELFGRQEREGWTVRGDQVGKFK